MVIEGSLKHILLRIQSLKFPSNLMLQLKNYAYFELEPIMYLFV
jgi:hypothetical protein